MAISRVSFVVTMITSYIFGVLLPAVQCQTMAPAPAPSNDGTSIDLGIAYVLMLVALILTYLIHPLDASSYSLF
ncbi:Arabinogalactan protein 20 [Ranunculus cassubicifolius]